MAEFPTIADIFEPLEGKTGTEANEQMRRWYTGTRQLPGSAPSEELTIIDDVIAPTSADVIVDTEGQAPADNLQIIKTESTHDGMIVSLRAANPDRAVTVLATGQLNGITLWNRATQYVLSTTESIALQRDGNMWREIRMVPPLASDSQLTLENTGMPPSAAQLASLYFRTATLEGRFPVSIANGGTGLTAAPSLLTNLATTTAASPLTASPRPGITGILPVANGGTGNSAGTGLIKASGYVSADGTPSVSFGTFSVTKTDTGTYAITHSFGNIRALATARSSATRIATVMSTSTTVTNVYLSTYNGNLVDYPFYFMLF